MSFKNFDFQAAYDFNYGRNMEEYELFIEKASDKVFAHNEFIKNFHSIFTENSNRRDLYDLMYAIEKDLKLNKDTSFDESLLKLVTQMNLGVEFANLYASFKADYDFINFINSKSNHADNEGNLNINPIIWSDKLTQRDFIRLIYSLQLAGYLQGEITKNVEEISMRLNFPLKSGWKSNFSKSIHLAKADFDTTKFFDELKDAFINRSLDLINKKK